MKKMILAFLLLFSAVTSSRAWSSGSDTVFVSFRCNQYSLTNAVSELAPNPQIFDLLESFSKPVYFAKVGAAEYDMIDYYTSAGLSVTITFEGYETISFRANPVLASIIGFNSKKQLIILSK